MASNSLGTLTLDLVARIGGFTAPLDQAERRAKNNAKGMSEAAKSASIAWSGLGGVIAGVFAGLSVGGVFAKFVAETKSAEAEQAQLAAVLRSTGEAAGFTRTELNDMAAAMEGRSIFSAGEINTAQTALLAFTGVVGDQFTTAMQAAMDMSARTGMTITQAAETIGRALDVPSKGLTALSKQGFRFTDDQKTLAKQLEASGKTAEAQGIILGALQESYGGAAQAARDTFGGALTALQNTIDGLLTGQDGSLDAARKGVEDLNAALADPATAAGVATLTDAMAGMTTKVVESIPFIIDAGDGVVRVFDVLGNTVVGLYATATAHLTSLMSSVAAGLASVTLGDTSRQFIADSKRLGIESAQGFDIAAQAAAAIKENLETPLKGTAMAELAKQAQEAKKALGEPPKAGSILDGKGAVAAAAAAKAAAAETKKQRGEVERMTKALLEQAAVLGMNEAQAVRYRFEQAGATSAQLAVVDGIAKEIGTRKEIAKAVAQHVDALREQRAVEQEIDAFRRQQILVVEGMGLGSSRRDQLQAEYQVQEEYAKKRLALEEAQRVESTKLDADAYRQRVEALEAAENQKIEILRESTAQRLSAEQDWALGVQESLQNYVDQSANHYQMAADAANTVLGEATSGLSQGLKDMVTGTEDLGDAFTDMALGMADSIVGALADMAAQWLVYQAVQMLVGKTTQASALTAMVGNATASSFQAGINAYASAAAIPITGWAMAPAAMSAALAATAPMVAAVSSAGAAGLAGMAHDGIDSVPADGTWFLQRGERVTTAETSAKLDATLDDVRRNQAPSLGKVDQHFNINGNPDQRTIELMRQAAADGARMGYQRVANDLASGRGPVSKSLSSGYSVGRRKT